MRVATTAALRRGAVVGQAVPGGEIEDLDRGREEADGPLDLGEALAVAGDEDDAAAAVGGKVAEDLADHAVGNGGEGHGFAPLQRRDRGGLVDDGHVSGFRERRECGRGPA